jgi:hypothetical protein
MPEPRVVEINDLPRCEPNISQSRVFAAGPTVVILYDAVDENWPTSRTWAVVRFDGYLTYKGGGPNDEALHNHPLFPSGLEHYSLQEVIDSPWIRTESAIAHKSGDPTRMVAGQRHFVFALKEDLFECIADSYTLVGLYESYDTAFAGAIESLRR